MPNSKRPTPAAQQKLVDQWNARVPVGANVQVRLDNGTVMDTTTRSAAELLSGHTAVVWLAGVRGCYTLDHVSVANG